MGAGNNFRTCCSSLMMKSLPLLLVSAPAPTAAAADAICSAALSESKDAMTVGRRGQLVSIIQYVQQARSLPHRLAVVCCVFLLAQDRGAQLGKSSRAGRPRRSHCTNSLPTVLPVAVLLPPSGKSIACGVAGSPHPTSVDQHADTMVSLLCWWSIFLSFIAIAPGFAFAIP